MMSIESSYNFREISRHVTTSGVVGRDRLKSLSSEGYEVVINLLPNDNKYAVPEEKEIVESQDITYIHIPIDFNDPQHKEYVEFTEVMDKLGAQKVHIHCAANWRVSAFYGAYAVSKGIWNSEKANHFISSIWKPSEHPVWQNFLKEFGLQ